MQRRRKALYLDFCRTKAGVGRVFKIHVQILINIFKHKHQLGLARCLLAGADIQKPENVGGTI